MIVPVLVVACDGGGVEQADRIALTDLDSIAILALVNDPATDLERLDVEVALDVRAAEGIIGLRNGPDGEYPSEDDEPFADIEALDAVPWVGASALTKLRDWALAHPGTGGELVEGVMFTGPEAEAVVWGVSGATEALLDDTVGLSSRAAANLAANGPYATVADIGEVAWVGPAALATLREFAPVWAEDLAAADHSGTFDGVDFDAATADLALSIANEATLDELVDGNVWSTGAQRIVAGRPFADLDALADTSGIGPATMQDLHDFATSGTWPSDDAGECDMTLMPSSHEAVDSYSANMIDFDPLADGTPYHLAAFSVPTCFEATSAGGQQALVDAIVGHAGWNAAIVEFPDMFTHQPQQAGSARFDGLLDDSIDHLADVRDDLLASGGLSADAFFDAMFELYQQVDAIGGPVTRSQGLRLNASECTERAGILVDPDAGLAVAIHQRAGC